MNLLGYDWPHLHAALNELPAALLFVTVLFDFGALVTGRESLRATALWTLWAGVLGGWLAVIAGQQAERVIDHGDALHELMETHETAAITTMSIFTVVLGYQLLRGSRMSRREGLALRALSIAGFVGIIWTGRIGGQMLFEHAAGVPTATLQTEMLDRAKGHHHHGHGVPDTDHDTAQDTAASRHP
ncbi:MAG TPA: DUF2231 domain-containing protein [Gemmatimonadales bacterium]|nr:DUF2231 domain-containing protein [Gemmatimonadales bacterium]